MTNPSYVALELVHIFCAVVGFGALAATGAYASLASSSSHPFTDDRLQRFFRPGHNLAALAVFAVPLLGGGLLWAGHGQDVSTAYPWIGLALWSVAALSALVLIWPAERSIQELIAKGPADGAAEALAAVCRRCSTGAAITSCLFVAAVIVMVGQP